MGTSLWSPAGWEGEGEEGGEGGKGGKGGKERGWWSLDGSDRGGAGAGWKGSKTERVGWKGAEGDGIDVGKRMGGWAGLAGWYVCAAGGREREGEREGEGGREGG